MCGICGVFQFDGAPASRELVAGMRLALRHRGPDGEGEFFQGPIGLGHRRLSIIDLEGGAQPIANEDGKLQIVFNGEIYNFIELREELLAHGHVFKTRSDTEVILHAYEQWGLDCLSRFNGIFAFALWDENRKELLLARDHLGVKPLYYTRVGKRLLFASEIKGILVDPECPREVDVKSLDQLLTLRYVLSPDTMFRGIKKLPPAHFMVVSAEGMRIEKYWKWTPKIRRDASERELIETYQELVEDAVRLQMRSDVPVGLWLSSGIDSGVLLALMTKYAGKSVHTFTIGFEDGEKSNETTAARALAERFGARHTEMIVGPEDYEAYFERHLWDLEEPLGSETAAAFYFVSLISGRDVKVALSGQGADEPWAGYPRHLGAKLSSAYSRLPRFLTDGPLKTILEKSFSNEKLRRGLFSMSEPDLTTRFIKIYSLYTPEAKARMLQPWVQEELSGNGNGIRTALRRLQSDVDGLDPLTQMLYVDTRANLPDDLLMVADKTSMANSLEVRVPFLDPRIVEFVESLPPEYKLRGFRGKYLHKKALEKWLPKSIVYQKKKGFDNPIDKWLRGSMRHYIGDCLLSETAAVNTYFERSYIREIVARHEQGRGNYLRHIFVLILFELWHQRFISAGMPVGSAA
jgi:asparagine synthase (glutamine-hydrolysing)